MNFETIEQRLENWGRVVRSPRFQSGECAAWAKLYVAIRDASKMLDAPAMTKDEADGWLIERAWAMLPNHVFKWTLKYTWVWNMSPEQVQTRMRKTHGANIRGRKIDLILADARTALCKNLSVLMAADALIKTASENSCKPAASAVE